MDGEVIWLYEVLAGVLQGCPASGSLFVIAINLCLNAINAAMGKLDICRAFADDIVNVVETIWTLPKIAKVFEVVYNASNLRLKIKKCVLIPLGGPPTQALFERVKMFLATHLPQWSDVRIASCGE